MCQYRKVMSYVVTDGNHQKMSIIDAPRSTGSILKPLLYAGMLDDGSCYRCASSRYPNADCGLYTSNFNLTFDGVRSAHRACAIVEYSFCIDVTGFWSEQILRTAIQITGYFKT
jgi:hypothetical protein